MVTENEYYKRLKSKKVSCEVGKIGSWDQLLVLKIGPLS